MARTFTLLGRCTSWRRRWGASSLVVAAIASAPSVRADDVRVTIRPIADDVREVVLERDGAIVATCSPRCDLTVPRGRYVVHELDDRRDERQSLMIGDALDVRLKKGERWRKAVGWSALGIGLILAECALVQSSLPGSIARASSVWMLLGGGGAVAFFGVWLESSPEASTHLEVKPARPTVAIAPSPGGASLVLSGAF